VIVDSQRRVVSVGYNGFPKGIQDDYRLDDRATKYELTCHAESNAIDFAPSSMDGCTIYTWPIPPCPRCAARIIQNGLIRVVSHFTPTDSDIGLRHQLRLSLEMLLEAQVTIHTYEEIQGATEEQPSREEKENSFPTVEGPAGEDCGQSLCPICRRYRKEKAEVEN
jgi:dCMP deaminase